MKKREGEPNEESQGLEMVLPDLEKLDLTGLLNLLKSLEDEKELVDKKIKAVRDRIPIKAREEESL